MTKSKSLLLLSVFFAPLFTLRGENASDSLVDAAWRAWQAPDYGLAERQFRAAIALDSTSERGYIGLALLENMRERPLPCWEALRALVGVKPQSYPYIFSFWQTIRFRMKDRYRESGLLDYLESLARASDDRGVLSAQTTEALEEYYRERGDIPSSLDWRRRANAISDWLLIGPFENVSASGYDKEFPPEREFDQAATYEGKGGVPASWFPIVSPIPDTWVDFTRHFPFRQSIFYANTFVYSPAKRRVHLRIGTSGSLRAFLNDELVIEYFDENNNDLDTYIVATELQQGWNRVLIKCGCSEIDKCNFLVRITDEHGAPLEGIRVSTDRQPYVHKPQAPVTVLDNEFESFFMTQVDSFPDRPENYALLGQVYLRDDKTPQAEHILRSALERWPRCSLFYTLMMETYVRGQKSDEIEELLSRVSLVDNQLPSVLLHRIDEAMRNEEFDKVEDLLAELKKQDYSPETIYQDEMSLYGKRKEVDKLVALAKQAAAEFPLNWQFANLEALIESEINHSEENAAAVVAAYLKNKYGVEQLNTLASYYLKADKVDKWESTMKEALAVSPTSTGYVYSMGLVYQLAKDYPKAEERFRRALELCPNSSLYWSKLAEVLKSTDRSEEAKSAYRTALKFDPRDFATRDALRSLEGKKPISSSFTSFPIDSLVRSAPDHAEYPNDNVIVLLDDTKRVVFEQGASMAMHEILVKVLDTKGIDALKEYAIAYNRYTEQLLVEKAVTVKKDGTEVKADVKGGEVVFKSLEPNECFYLKWKVKNYYNGMLSKHFWDTHYFNGLYPERIGRYALLVPKDVPFTHQTQFMRDAPSVRQTDDGVLYEWISMNEPGIHYEDGMPGLQDVGKVLFISSLPSWEFVANWFSDLARTKTRGTFEIHDRVASLLDGKPGMNEEERVKAVYDFITENIRYSSVPFRNSAYVPQRARDVLVQRLGDCKDVATLCIAMLNEAGIKSHYVLVNTWNDGLNRNIPPSIAFNHCIVGVEMKSGVRYIDLTASNYPFGSIPITVKGAFSLPIEPGENRPTYLASHQFSANTLIRTSSARLKADNSLALDCASRRLGATSAYVRSRYRNRNRTDRVKELTEILASEFPNVSVEDVSVKNIDRLDSELDDHYSYSVPQFLSDAGNFKLMRMPWADKLEPNEALSYKSRTYPYVFGHANDTTMETLRVTFPPGYSMTEIPKPIRLTNPAGTYSVTYSVSKSEIVGKRTLVQSRSIVPPEEYSAYKKFYNEALKEDNRQFILKKKR